MHHKRESGMRRSGSDEMADASCSTIPLKQISNRCGVLSLADLRVLFNGFITLRFFQITGQGGTI